MESIKELIAANMPAPKMLENFLNDVGETLPSNYEGTNTSISLANIFEILLEEEQYWIYDSQEPLPLIVLSDEEYLGMMTRRFKLSDKEHNLIKANYNMLEDRIDKWVRNKTYTRYEIFLYLTALLLTYRYVCKIEGSKVPVFAGLWQVWEKTYYPEILPPLENVVNVLEMFNIAYNENSQRQFPRDVLPNSEQFEDAVYVAFQLKVETIINFWLADINSKEIRILLDSGMHDRDALELGETIPDVWIEALNMEPRKWQ